jgi:hypothetical protein
VGSLIKQVESTVLRIGLTIDASIIKNVLQLPGVEIGSIYKIRCYWHQTDHKIQATMTPMGFPEIDLKRFILEGGGKILAKHLGLDDHFYDDIYEQHHERSRGLMLYYCVSRNIMGFVLNCSRTVRLYNQSSGTLFVCRT